MSAKLYRKCPTHEGQDIGILNVLIPEEKANGITTASKEEAMKTVELLGHRAEGEE